MRAGERLALGALLAAVAVLLLFRLGAGPLQSSAEERVWDVMGAMARSGDWLVPRQDGIVRLQKPPLYYWAATACAELGLGVTQTALRLPAALAGLALLLVTWRWGRRLGGPALGLLSAATLACMLQFSTLARCGVAEMFLALFTTLALAAFDRLAAAPTPPGAGRAACATEPPRGGSASGRRALLPWFALWTALALLSKATAALMLIGVPIALLLTLQRRWRDACSRRVLLWMAAALACGFLWYGVLVVAVPEAFGKLQAMLLLPFGVRLPGAETSAVHARPAHFFVASLLLSALPASVLLPTTVARAVRSRLWAGERVRFVALAFVSLFLCFSLIPQKQKHYMLPLLPLLAILCAEAVLSLQARAPAALRRLLLAVALLAALLGLPALFVLRVLYVQAMHLPAAVSVGVSLAGAALLGLLLRAAWRGQLQAFAVTGTAGVLLLLLCYQGSLELWQRQFESGEVARRADYDGDRWRAVFEAWPALEGAFRAGVSRG